ncbi:MAG: hypothetical protein EOO83_04425 [Oxalobacteraceae bacterium]|nr:MAG: hypothetical protein EOO83_04425 [Oxalobacteraceae bacterium]
MTSEVSAPEAYAEALAKVTPGLAAREVDCALPETFGAFEMASGAHIAEGAKTPLCTFEVQNGNHVFICAGATLTRCTLHVSGKGGLIIIGPEARLKNVVLMVSGRDSAVVVGARTSWESGRGFSSKQSRLLAIGQDCMFSHSVTLRTNDAHGIFDLATQDHINPPEDVVVHAHVWLGSGVRVSKGAEVGASTIVGQASVATGKLDPRCVYAGIPARKLRENVTWSRTTAWDDIPVAFRS